MKQIPITRCQYCGSNDIGEGWQHGEALSVPRGKIRETPSMNELLKSLYDNYYEEFPLTDIKAEVDPFWPWRESEIADLFNSFPPGDYCMTAWDVYKDGIFQRTEYNIKVL